MRTLLLASASPSRKKTLISAGITPLIAVSDIPETILLADFQTKQNRALTPAEQVNFLATEKACHVHKNLNNLNLVNIPDVILGCDSMFEINGKVRGKPHTPDNARERLYEMQGNMGILHTGHCLIDTKTGKTISQTAATEVYISKMNSTEIESYIATNEPLHVAGSFTIDGLGGSFVEKIVGDPHSVVGLSLPLLRQMLNQLGYSITEFWN